MIKPSLSTSETHPSKVDSSPRTGSQWSVRLGAILGLWAVMRLLTSLWAAFVSPIRPFTEIETQIPLWPPAAPLSQWLDRIFAAPWLRWDTTYYLRIVSQGYRTDDGTSQFHPLFPWLAEPFAWLTGHPLPALLLVSSLATLALLIAFYRLARLDLYPAAAWSSLLYFLFFPPAFIFFAPYTESLFVLWSVLAFYWARQRSWWLAGLAGGLATLTRQQGLFLVIPLMWELWEAADRNPRRVILAWRDWLALGLIPAGLLVWIIYRAVALRDVAADYTSLQSLLYSVVISPSSSKVVPVQAFWWPWRALWFALVHFWQTLEFSLGVDLVVGAVFITLLILAWPKMRISYRLYAVVILLVSFAYHTGPFYPYMGLPRHLLLAFPVFIGLGARLTNRRQRQVYLGLGLLGIFFMVLLYVIEGWVP